MSSTLVLNRSDIEKLMEREALFEKIKKGFVAIARAGPEYRGARHPIALPATDGAAGMVLSPGLIPRIPAYTVKVNSKFPEHPPAIKGVVVLHSLDDGRVMAILDLSTLTLARTAIAGAIGADILARPDSEILAIIGCGVQGSAQLEWIVKLRPIKQVFLHDTVSAAAERLAADTLDRFDITATVCGTAREAAIKADIVVTATWAENPFLFNGDVGPGTHITTIGPDGPNEAELGADLLLASRFFADSSELQVEMGSIGGAGLGQDAIAAELGEVMAGLKRGRQNENEITVYGMVGLPFEDLATAWFLYRKALTQNVGTKIAISD